MTYYDESAGGWIQADPHTDSYFGEEAEESEIGTADVALSLDALTEKQRFVVECRYGLRPGQMGVRMTVKEIAALMGIHRKGVYEHEQAALVAMRRGLDPVK